MIWDLISGIRFIIMTLANLVNFWVPIVSDLFTTEHKKCLKQLMIFWESSGF